MRQKRGVLGERQPRRRILASLLVLGLLGACDDPASRPAIPAADPYPPNSDVVAVEWAPPDTILRAAFGSDNWPLTWGDDDLLYGAYGDGWGFEPDERKLSLGLVRIAGQARDFSGEDLSAPSIEQLGDGASGIKASGILMVDGVLYLLARNADNSRLARSSDRGASWVWAPWKFDTSLGVPTFLNYGRNYQGARDDFVYVYSSDSEEAYRAADRMVLARVARDALFQRDAWEFFAGRDVEGRPQWTREIAERAAVFEFSGRCWRSGVSYSAPLGLYLWVQVEPNPRLGRPGGLGIYGGPEPWGPWTTVFRADPWDVAVGESAHFPTKWMAADGRSAWLVFSGDDSFSVREARFTIRPGSPLGTHGADRVRHPQQPK